MTLEDANRMAEEAVDLGIKNLKEYIEELEQEDPWRVDETGMLVLANLNMAKHRLARLEESRDART